MFESVVFWVCDALDVPLERILAPSLGRSGPKMDPKSAEKWSEKLPKSDQKMIPKHIRKIQILDPEMGSKMGQVGDHGARAQPSGRCLGSSWSQDAPKIAQDSLK